MRISTIVLAPALAVAISQVAGEPPRADTLSPDIVRLTGVGPPVRGLAAENARTFAVEIAGREAPKPGPAATAANPEVPKGAFWPDERDRIRLGADGPGHSIGLWAPNPWEVRMRRAAAAGIPIACGGIIAAESGESVAILNGHLARKGSVVAGFTVAGVTRDAVVLEANGSYLVIPRGRRVTVEP